MSYKSYWANSLLTSLKNYTGQSVSILDLSRLTSILVEDVIATLQFLGVLVPVEDNPHNVILYCPSDHLERLLEKYPLGSMPVDPTRLHWAPLYITDPKKDKWSIKSYTGLPS